VFRKMMAATKQVEAGGAIGLVLELPIAQFAELVEEERAGRARCVLALC
jgi:ketopantoate hydroxymethyltransferase